jgi:hypothetical protein
MAVPSLSGKSDFQGYSINSLLFFQEKEAAVPMGGRRRGGGAKLKAGSDPKEIVIMVNCSSSSRNARRGVG